MDRILVLNNDLDIGGIQKSLIAFLKYLSGLQKYQIDLLVWNKDGKLKNQLPKSVKLIDFEHVKPLKNIFEEKSVSEKLKQTRNYLKFYFYEKIVKKPWLYFPKMNKDYDTVIAYCHNGYPRFYAIDQVLAKQRLMWYHHGSYHSHGENFELDKEYYNKFDKIVTVSEANKKMLANQFLEQKDKLLVIPNIIDAEQIWADSKEVVSDMISTENVYNFVTVSRFSKEKGIDLAIKIASELKKNGLKFKWYFIGDGENFSEMNALRKDYQVEDCCIFLGEKQNPYPYIKLADLYIQTSYVESQSITICEALVLKKLIAATNLPAINETLQNGSLGILCSPEASSFVEEISNILSNKDQQLKLLNAVEKYEVKNNVAFNQIAKLF